MAYTTSYSLFDTENKITVNGVTMTATEYRKQLKAKQAMSNKKQPKKRKAKKRETEITILPAEIKTMLKCAKVMKSLSAYYDHGYRQWGRICRDIINLKEIRPHFVLYRSKATEVEQTINDIADIAKRNQKAVFAFVRKLSWQLEDIKEHMQKLYKGATSSGVIEAFGNHEAINGEGRRLGLRILMIRTFKAVQDLENVIKRLQTIADTGVDVFDIHNHLSDRAVKASVV